ncbi:MAG: hypothetical protein JKX81_18005 [Arenicella sp.]|nr:hypothetical protein [Arenicella sp.]
MRSNILSLVFIMTALLISFSGSASAKQSNDQNSYYLYGDPRPGSKFKQILYKNDVPFDTRYSDMSSTLQARVKAAYGGLKDSEHPPFPSEGTQAIYYPLYKANRDLRDEGDVLVIAVIGTTGEVKQVSIYKAPTASAATLINYIISNTKFDPASCDGSPCEMEYLFETKLETKPSKAR